MRYEKDNGNNPCVQWKNYLKRCLKSGQLGPGTRKLR